LVVAAVVFAGAVITSVALAPLMRGPLVHSPVPEFDGPALGVARTSVSPAGSRSATSTPVALLGPLFVAVTVNVTLLPRFGVGLSTVFVMAMSAATGVTVATAELLPATGSVCISPVLVAV